MNTKFAVPVLALALLYSGSALYAKDSQTPAPPADKSDVPAASPVPSPRPLRVRIGGNAARAQLTHMVQPKYPEEAKQNVITGTVVLHAVIALDGRVQDLQFVSGPPDLVGSAMDAVRQWRYKPMKFQGKPVEVDTTVSVVYTLSG